MIIAELQGKISSKYEGLEDLLTSNVFSFLKYSDREIFLFTYLNKLNLKVSKKDAIHAEFIFWPTYEDGTEPDLIIFVGKYYLLFEAKFRSDFAPKTLTTASQLDREIKMGKMEAKSLKKEFKLITITADYSFEEQKFRKVKAQLDDAFIWTNWHAVALMIDHILETLEQIDVKDKIFARDLFDLLVKKRLRNFAGLINLQLQRVIKPFDQLFYNSATANFKGAFTGFPEVLNGFRKLQISIPKLFEHHYFSELHKVTIKKHPSTLFYNGR